MKVDKLLVTKQSSIRCAIEKLTQNQMGILLLIDEEGRLLRTVTDSDIRKLLLKNIPQEDKLAVLESKVPITVGEKVSPAGILNLMDEHAIDHVPVLDSNGCPQNLVQRQDITNAIFLSPPHLSGNEDKYINQALESNWIAPLGPNVDYFEKEIAEFSGVNQALALSSGTAALHLALIVLGVKRDDYVFCSSFSFIASATPILYQGAIPVFIDSDFETWNMSPQALARAFVVAESKGQLPKAVIVANIYGQSADMDAITSICDGYDVPVVEDAAESLGASYRGKPSGSLGRIGIFFL